MTGSIETLCDETDGILRIRVFGIPTVDEYIATMDECYAKFEFKHALWDFTESALSSLSADSFRTIGAAGAQFADKRGPGAKTAFAVKSRSEILLMKAFADRAKPVTPIHFHAFLSMEDAMAWLNE